MQQINRAIAVQFTRVQRVLVVVLTSAALSTALSAAQLNSAYAATSKQTADAVPLRTTIVLNALDWHFVQDDTLTDKAALASDGASWEKVSLPHTWNAKDAANTAQTTPQSVKYKRGLGWYRLVFNNGDGNPNQWLQFDGASIVADVWLNGEKLGQHSGAFTRFRFDLKGKLRSGDNVLLVKTDNSEAKTASDPTAIIPLSGDFNMSGGLYRTVSIVTTRQPAHFRLDDFGSLGIFAKTTEVSKGNAVINVNAKISNGFDTDAKFSVVASLLDSNGKKVASTHQTLNLKANQAGEVAQNLRIMAPHLWQGLEDPYLYQLVLELQDKSGAVIDEVKQHYGIREIRYDRDLGFFLNGKSYPLHGVNLHQDKLGKGWAISNADIDESLAMIKDIGANTIRLAHYPHSNYTYEQADKLGFIVWAELPYVNNTLTEQDCRKTIFAPSQLIANARMQLKELIRQQYNHASIGMWSVANEVAQFGWCGVDSANRNYLPGKADSVSPLLRELNSLAKYEDASRVSALADYSEDRWAGPDNMFVPTGGITDIWGINRYTNWYYDNTGSSKQTGKNLGMFLDKLHAKYPNQPIGVTEYGAGAATTHQTDNPNGGAVCRFDSSKLTRVCYQPEGYASLVHELNYLEMRQRPYVWGTYVWNMFDFGSGSRHEGDIGSTNTKGLVTFDRQIKKDAFYFYQANWSKKLVAYITDKRYTDRAYAVVAVKVYSNADLVQLKLNGKAIATLSTDQCPQSVCLFKQVRLVAGANNLSIEAYRAKQTASDSVVWTLNPDNASNVYIAAGQPVTGFTIAGHRYGSDNFFSVDGTSSVGVSLPPLATISRDGKPLDIAIGADERNNERMIWDAYREGAAFSYEIPVAPGAYTVTLGFLEPDASGASGKRVFSVSANGVVAVSELDIVSAAGAARVAISRSFKVLVDASGKLKLDFNGMTGNAIVSNIAVMKN